MKPGDSLPDPTLSTPHTSRGPAGSPPTQLLTPVAFSVTSDLAGPLLPETPCPLSLRHPHPVPSPRPSRPPLLRDQLGPWLPGGAIMSSPRPAHLSQPVHRRPRQMLVEQTNEQTAGVRRTPGSRPGPDSSLRPTSSCSPFSGAFTPGWPAPLLPQWPCVSPTWRLEQPRASPETPSALGPQPPRPESPGGSSAAQTTGSSRPHGPLPLLQPCRLPRSSAVRERRRG